MNGRSHPTLDGEPKSPVLHWFLPTSGAAHMGNAGCAGAGIDSSDIFINQLGFVAGGFDPRGLGD